MGKDKRERAIEEDCPRCGAKAGERCKGFKGKGKAPCRLETEAVKRRRREKEREPTQRVIFDYLGWPEGT